MIFQNDRWIFQESLDPVITTAVHQGHSLRAELRPNMKLSDQEWQREEDPMTGALAMVHGHFFRQSNIAV